MRAADAALEAAVLHAVLVVLHQLVHVLGRHRPPVGARRQRRDDLSSRTRPARRRSRRCRAATEDALAARRRTDALRVERSLQLERVHAIQAILSAAGREHLQLVVGLGKRPALERHADLVRSGRRGEADVLQPGVDAIQRAVLHLIVELHVFFAADHRLVNHLVVERHDQRVLELHAVAPDVGGHVGDVDDVVAVGREIDAGEDASARAQRQAGDVRELGAWPGAERPAAGSCVRPAERLHGHCARGDHILFDEGRRYLQRRRDVVEPLRNVVRRQHLVRIEIDGEQVANRVRVFLAIEPMQDDLVAAHAPDLRRGRGSSRARRPVSPRSRHRAGARRAAASPVRASCARPSRTRRRAGRCPPPSRLRS